MNECAGKLSLNHNDSITSYHSNYGRSFIYQLVEAIHYLFFYQLEIKNLTFVWPLNVHHISLKHETDSSNYPNLSFICMMRKFKVNNCELK